MNNITYEELQSRLSRVKSADTFVEEARALYDDLFDYTKVDYLVTDDEISRFSEKVEEFLKRYKQSL